MCVCVYMCTSMCELNSLKSQDNSLSLCFSPSVKEEGEQATVLQSALSMPVKPRKQCVRVCVCVYVCVGVLVPAEEFNLNAHYLMGTGNEASSSGRRCFLRVKTWF